LAGCFGVTISFRISKTPPAVLGNTYEYTARSGT